MTNIVLVGPLPFAQWRSSYTILANCLFMLGAVDIGNLDDYRKYHERFHDKFGDSVYTLQYQADVRTRSEEFIRMKREGETSYAEALEQAHNDPDYVCHAYNPKKPWDYVLAKSFDTIKAKKWWHAQLEYPSLALVGGGKANLSDVLGGDTRIGQHKPPTTPPGVEQQHPLIEDVNAQRQPRGQKRPWEAAARPQKARVHNVQEGVFMTSRTNKPLCEGWSLGTCTDTHPGTRACRANPSQMHLCKLLPFLKQRRPPVKPHRSPAAIARIDEPDCGWKRQRWRVGRRQGQR